MGLRPNNVVATALDKNTPKCSRRARSLGSQPTTRGGARNIHQKMHKKRVAVDAREGTKLRWFDRETGSFPDLGFPLPSSSQGRDYTKTLSSFLHPLSLLPPRQQRDFLVLTSPGLAQHQARLCRPEWRTPTRYRIGRGLCIIRRLIVGR
jgi:hypothetical protein